jgi:hypothetical protein
MDLPVCETCGLQYEAPPPTGCAVCMDDRQWEPEDGTHWTTLEEMRGRRYRNVIHELEPGIRGVGESPHVHLLLHCLSIRLLMCVSLIILALLPTVMSSSVRLFGTTVTEPKFGIGQACYLVESEGTNVLWDCITHLDQPTIDAIKALGSVSESSTIILT